MNSDEITVRRWQELYQAGAFESDSQEALDWAGWNDFYDPLNDRGLQNLCKLVMSITHPFVLDNYHVYFLHHTPGIGPMFGCAYFDLLSNERSPKSFHIALDSPRERKKWVLETRRYGDGGPEFECGDIRSMSRYINDMAHELEQDTTLHVDVTESGPSYQQSMQLPDPDDWMAWPDPKRIKAYHRAVLDAITADPPTKDMTAVFQADLQGLPAFRNLAAKIDSMVQTVEDVDGKFFGVTVCRIKGGLDAIEAAMLKEYCRALNDEDLEIKEFYCPPSKYHDHLEVEIWRDKDQFIFARQEMKRPLPRKSKQRAAQKGKKGKECEQR